MRFIPAEPDLATVVRRIELGDIDLQPDFQRGEVWPTPKKQRLIDSILRGWVVPPVLLISNGSGSVQQVLDGQQRLASIRDFVDGKFSVDGGIEPLDKNIRSLHGLKFDELPSDVSRAFLRTPIRAYEINDYRPEEPAEIFFRLNQPTTLSPAEKRNAFFGPVRDQIRGYVKTLTEDLQDPSSSLGFTNSRMAFDDVFARLACTLEQGSLWQKVTAVGINSMYRREAAIDNAVDARIRSCIRSMLQLWAAYPKGRKLPRLNKATFYSWLLFFARAEGQQHPALLAEFFGFFELGRAEDPSNWSRPKVRVNSVVSLLAEMYTDRASSRVADVSSVVIRDVALWSAWAWYCEDDECLMCREDSYGELESLLSGDGLLGRRFSDDQLLDFANSIGWGRRI